MPTLLSDPLARDQLEGQWLFEAADLEYTPTVVAGLMKASEERTRRRKAVSLIYKVAERMGLMSHVVSTAALFFHRFFMRRQMRPIGYVDRVDAPPVFLAQDVALAALYLATKVEESYRKLDDIVHLSLEFDARINETISDDKRGFPQSVKDDVLWCEERLLETLCFDLIVEHPQKSLILAGRKLGVDPRLLRVAFAHLHDALRDPVCTFYEAPVLAAGVFALACQDADIDASEFQTAVPPASSSSRSSPSGWLQVFDVEQSEVDAVVSELKEVRETMLLSEKTAVPSLQHNSKNGRSSSSARQQGSSDPLSSTASQASNSLAPTPMSRAENPSPALVSDGVSATTSPLPPPPMERLGRPELARPLSRHGGTAPHISTAMASASATDASSSRDAQSYVPQSPVLATEARAADVASEASRTYAPVSPPGQANTTESVSTASNAPPRSSGANARANGPIPAAEAMDAEEGEIEG